MFPYRILASNNEVNVVIHTLYVRDVLLQFVHTPVNVRFKVFRDMVGFVERPTLSLSFIDTYTYLPYLCTEYPYISTDSFLSVRHFSPQCFAPDTEVRHLVTFIYLVLTSCL